MDIKELNKILNLTLKCCKKLQENEDMDGYYYHEELINYLKNKIKRGRII